MTYEIFGTGIRIGSDRAPLAARTLAAQLGWIIYIRRTFQNFKTKRSDNVNRWSTSLVARPLGTRLINGPHVWKQSGLRDLLVDVGR